MNLYDAQFKVGSLVEVETLAGVELIVERLHELGIRIGTQLEVVGYAPFQGPLLLRFKSTLIALRKEEAQCTKVKLISGK